MKFYIVASALDLNLRLGCTPAWWQLFKALNELGHELLITPYVGDPVESLWWRTTPNPARLESLAANSAIKTGTVKPIGTQPLTEKITMQVVKNYIRPKWRKHMLATLEREEVDAVWFINAPLNHITGIPSDIKRHYPQTKVLYYDGDMPGILPGFFQDRKFKMAYYNDADLSEYDAFFTNSEGVIPALEELGATNVQPLHYAVDPDLYSPVQVDEHSADIFYYAHGSEAREERMNFMLSQPSRAMPEVDFLLAGKGFGIDVGNVRRKGVLSINDWRIQACRSKINLNITRSTHASVYASSTARPFELASLQSCVVSDPYEGLDTWFEPGKELHIASNAKAAVDLYHWLLEDDIARIGTARAARERVLKDHTYKQRAAQVVKAISSENVRTREVAYA